MSSPPQCFQMTAVLTGMKGSRLDYALSLVLPSYGLRARQRLCKKGSVRSGSKALPCGFILPSDDFQVNILLGPDDSSNNCGREKERSPGQRPSGVFIVAANRNFVAFAKPPKLATARIKGSATQSLEGLLPAIWPELLHEFSQKLLSNTEEKQGGVSALSDLLGLPVPVLVNRLDGLTSGLVLTAFGPDNADLFRRMESAGEIDKVYYALVRGRICEELLLDKSLDMENRDKTMVLNEADPDKLRHTCVKPLKVFSDESTGPATLVSVHIKRGARHQIRAHLADAGFPICGDALYAHPEHPVTEENSFGDRLYLHHARLSFPGFSADLSPGWNLGEEAVHDAESCSHIFVKPD